MRYFLLFLLLFSAAITGFAQCRISLSAQEFSEFRQATDSIAVFDLLSSVVDRPCLEEQTINGSHFLRVFLDENAGILALAMQANSTLSLVGRNDKRTIEFQVMDTTGQLLNDAILRSGNRSWEFDNAQPSLVLKKRKLKDEIRIFHPADTTTFRWSERAVRQRNSPWWKSRVKRFFGRPGQEIAFWVSLPFKKNRKRILRQYRRVKASRRNSFYRGYTAFSQPIYRHGDTLALKLYIANKRGKPTDLPAKMRIQARQSVVDTLLAPIEKGVYVYEMPITDTLELNRIYRVEAQVSKRRKAGRVSGQFKVEDYQLDKVNWQVDTPAKVTYGDSIRLMIAAKDANSNFIVDGRVRGTVKWENLQAFVPDEVNLNDTLFVFDQPLLKDKITQISIPLSVVPNADLRLKIQLRVNNSNGESEEFKKSIMVNALLPKLTLALRDSFLIGKIENDSSGAWKTALLTQTFSQQLQHDTLTLPFQIPLNPMVNYYNLKVLDQTVNSVHLRSGERNHGVEVAANWQEETLRFRLQNEHYLPVQIEVFAGTKRIQTYATSARALSEVLPAAGHKLFTIKAFFIWGGVPRSVVETARPYDGVLQVKMKQPEQIIPGELVQTSVQVLDYRGRPVEGMNLTANAINGQFSDQATDLPVTKSKELKPYAHQGDLSIVPISSHSLSEKITIDTAWWSKLGLEDSIGRRIRFGDAPVIQEVLPIEEEGYADKALLVPVVYRGTAKVAPHLVYLNYRLVYFSGAALQHLVFEGRPGWNTLEIRTFDGHYKMDSVFLTTGAQTIVHVNTEILRKQAQNSRKWTFKSKPDTLLRDEALLIENRFLAVANSQFKKTFAVWQEQSPLIINQNYRSFWGERARRQIDYQLVGPLAAQQATRLLIPDQSNVEFSWNSDHYYRVEGTLIYASNKPKKAPWTGYSLSKAYRSFSYHLPYLPSDVTVRTGRKVPNFFGFPYLYTNSGHTIDYQWIEDLEKPLVAQFLLNDQDSLLRFLAPETDRLKNLPQGDYRLIFLAADSTAATTEFTVKDYEHQYRKFGNLPFVADPEMADFLTFFNSIKTLLLAGLPLDVPPSFDQSKSAIYGHVHLWDSAKKELMADPGIEVGIYQNGLKVGASKLDLSGNYWIETVPGQYRLVATVKNTINPRLDGVVLPINVPEEQTLRLDLTIQTDSMFINRLQQHPLDSNFVNYRRFVDRGYLNVLLEALQEIVVSEYSISLIQRDNTTQGSTVTAEHIHSLPTRNINGLAGMTAGVGVTSEQVTVRGSRAKDTYFYVDGIRVEGDLVSSANTETVRGHVTSRDGEPLLFANVAAFQNGVLVGGTETDLDGYYELGLASGLYSLKVTYTGFFDQLVEHVSVGTIVDIVMQSGVNLDEVAVREFKLPLIDSETRKKLQFGDNLTIRDRFADHAYWEPNLWTDRNGNVTFQTVFPENSTSWKTTAFGMDKKGRVGVQQQTIRAFQPLSAELATPRFLLAGDRATLIGKVNNLTNQPTALQTAFLVDDVVVQQTDTTLVRGIVESATIEVPTAVDSLSLTYALKTEDFSDGEAYAIPVFPVGVKETTGELLLIENDTSFIIRGARDDQPTEVLIANAPWQVFIEDLDYLRNYPHGCNEQSASRLRALLLLESLAPILPTPIDVSVEIQEMIDLLTERQLERRDWSWFTENDAIPWVSTYVTEVLADAHRAGYLNTASSLALERVAQTIDNQYDSRLLEQLVLLSENGLSVDYTAALAPYHVDSLSTTDRLRYLTIRQQSGQKITATDLDFFTLDAFDIRRGWVENTSLVRSEVQQLLLAIPLYEALGDEGALTQITNYFLFQRQQNMRQGVRRVGRNTLETALILNELLPVIGDKMDGAPAQLMVNANLIAAYPYRKTLSPGETLEIAKSGAATTLVSMTQTSWNTNPKPQAKGYSVTTTLTNSTSATAPLRSGDNAELEVQITATASSDYVLLEIPIPAGCSAVQKQFYSRFRTNHREYFRDRVAIYYRNLPQGKHTVTLPLEVRFAGNYHLNPVLVEQMYLPLNYGRNGLEKVRIER